MRDEDPDPQFLALSYPDPHFFWLLHAIFIVSPSWWVGKCNIYSPEKNKTINNDANICIPNL